MARLFFAICVLFCLSSVYCGIYEYTTKPFVATPFNEAPAPRHTYEGTSIGSAETEALAAIEHSFTQGVNFLESTKNYIRPLHVKQHGCVTGTLTITYNDKAPAALPIQFRRGLFAQDKLGKSYNVYARFSNGKGGGNSLDDITQVADYGVDVRAIALKVFAPDVATPQNKPFIKNFANDPTIDFLMTTAPQFFIPNAVAAGSFFTNFFDGTAAAWFKSHLSNALIVAKMGAQSIVRSLSGATYFTGTPFAMGQDTAVTYRLKPCKEGTDALGLPSKNMYRERLIAKLKNEPVCFYLQLAEYINNQATPIDDATKVWDIPASGWWTVAKLNIPMQFLPDEEFCRRTVYNPWNMISEFQPLGRLNRARRVAYTQVAKIRQGMVNMANKDRTWDEVFRSTSYRKPEAELDEMEIEQEEQHEEEPQTTTSHPHHHPSINVEVDVQVN